MSEKRREPKTFAAALRSDPVSAESEAEILALYEAGRIGEAQAIILEDLERWEAER